MTIKAEKWDQERGPERRVRWPMLKSLLLSLLSVYVLVFPVCLLASWLLGWTWVDPDQTRNLTLLEVGLRAFWHSLQMTFFLLLRFWYVTVPVVWLNAVAISRRRG
jgi:hypothetical protein